MHALPLQKVDLRIWDRLAANVRRLGPGAIQRALDEKLYPVPDVSGAKGRHQTRSAEKLPCPILLPCPCLRYDKRLMSLYADQHCQLTSYPVGRRFKEDTQLNRLMADLFEGIAEGSRATALPLVRASHLVPFSLFLPQVNGNQEKEGIMDLFFAVWLLCCRVCGCRGRLPVLPCNYSWIL